MIDLSIVILNWNVRALLDRCLASVRSERYAVELIVVDNASTDDSAAMVREKYPHAKLIVNDINRGFTGGNNQGIAAAAGRYVLVLNPDTELVDNALDRLTDYLEAQPEVGAVGPMLLNSDRSIQPSRRRFPAMLLGFFESTWLQGVVPHRVLRRYYMDDVPATVVQDVDWLTGACTLFRRAVFDRVGGYDAASFFMYSEELDLCRRIKQAGWRIAYLPDAQVIHYEGKSSEQAVAARHIRFNTSKVRYYRKWHGRAVAEALRWWLLSQYAWQIGLESIKAAAGHRRALRLQRVAAYKQVIRSGLK
jgi:GT2 family glycosyltransferase